MRPRVIAIAILTVLMLAALCRSAVQQNNSAELSLGEILFHDDRFCSPAGDLNNSCSSCHHFDEDPQGLRAHTDFFARSWVPWRAADPRRDGLRNAPTILDAALMPRLHFDGEFSSLEDLVKGTLSGRSMGWLEGEREQALDRVYNVVLNETGKTAGSTENYRTQFKNAYGVNLDSLRRDEVIDLIARALTSYLRTLKTARTSPYDQFIQSNSLEDGPARGEDPKLFAKRLLTRVSALERTRELRMPAGFDSSALTGLKIFLTSDGSTPVGNCVSCHAPPLFTDFSFHNIGISQTEYDQVHGEGSFAGLSIPSGTRTVRPSLEFRETPSKRKPGYVDLGYWNFADVKASPVRRANESDDRFLQRMIAAFKTPTLRNLAFSQPYMHNGAYPTVDGVIRELGRLSELVRAGRVREADDELLRVRISESDIAPLVAFLKTLNEDLKRRY